MNVAAARLLDLYDTARLHAGAANSGAQGPHAFIRGLNADYDRELLLSQWFKPLGAGDDLRVEIKADGDTFWALMERLPWDSEFFGMEMARLNAFFRPDHVALPRADVASGALALASALEVASKRGITYILAPIAPTDLYALRILAANGFELIETRCHYHRALVNPPEQRYSVRLATAVDVPSLARTARIMVNPFDRFHADPMITESDGDRMMERWIEASILHGFADATVVPDVENPEAFCTAKYHREHWDGWGVKLAQPVLSAVAPRHKGWYVRIISELDEHLRSVGAEHSVLITQLTNNAVIRCWEKLGYQFGKGEYVFRKVLQ